MNWFFITLFIIIVIEFSLYTSINFLRKFFDSSFMWKKNRVITNLITKNYDLYPQVKRKNLLQFFLYFYDKKLGSINKSNITNIDFYEKKNSIVKTKYSIDKKGSRTNNKFKNKNIISSYGDSITFCRHVNDNQTWQYYLSEFTKSNVKNFGVGNYGLDQAFLRLKKQIKKDDKSKIILLGVCPETIRRNLSLWKHFFEFGNIFNFKPRYAKDRFNNKTILETNPIKSFNDYNNLKKVINEIKKKDYFYEKKFKQYLWGSPYIISFLKNPKKKAFVFFYCFFKMLEINYKIKIFKKSKSSFSKDVDLLGGLYLDFQDKLRMFKDNNILQTTINIIKKIKILAKKNNRKIILIIFPSHYDLIYKTRANYCYYKSLVLEGSKHLEILDIGEHISDKKRINNFFADFGYGGHYNKTGNKMISRIIYLFLKKKGYLN